MPTENTIKDENLQNVESHLRSALISLIEFLKYMPLSYSMLMLRTTIEQGIRQIEDIRQTESAKEE